MAVRPHDRQEQCTIFTLTVDTAAVTVGCGVKYGAGGDEFCQPLAAVTDLPIAIVVSIGGNTAVTAGAVGDRVQVALLNGGVVPVKVGTAATRGQSAIYGSASALTDGAPSDATPTYAWALGYFTQSGATGDMVGLALARHIIIQ